MNFTECTCFANGSVHSTSVTPEPRCLQNFRTPQTQKYHSRLMSWRYVIQNIFSSPSKFERTPLSGVTNTTRERITSVSCYGPDEIQLCVGSSQKPNTGSPGGGREVAARRAVAHTSHLTLCNILPQRSTGLSRQGEENVYITLP